MSKLKYKINNQWVDLDFGAYITNAVINSEDHLMVTLSDNRHIDAGSLGRRTIDISKAVITLNENSYTYNGSSHLPSITGVTLNNQELELNTDYAIIVTSGEINAGQYILRIIGINNYSGIASTTWTIAKAQATISGDDSISIRGIGESVSKTYTTNGDGTFSFSASGGVATTSNIGGTVTVTSTEIGNGIMTVSVSEGQNYLGITKDVELTIVSVDTADVFGVVWDYSLSSPELTRLTLQTDPYEFVTVVPSHEPTACIGSEGGQSDFDNHMPWLGMQRYNYVNGQVIDFVDYNNGETYVYIPEFWSKIVNDSENQKMYFYISDSELVGFVKHPGSGKYMSRYECNNNFLSAPGTKPKDSIGLGGFRTSITAIDNKHYQYDIHTYAALELLYIVEFAHLNTQSKIGAGITSGGTSLTIGETDILTYHTGRVNGTADSVSAIQYRWIENLWGNVWNWVDGILTQNDVVYICNDRTKYDSSITNDYESTGLHIPTAFGWQKTVQDYNDCYLIPLSVGTGSSDSTYACDHYYYFSGVRGLLVGGNCIRDSKAGLFCWYSSNAPDEGQPYIGGRTMLIINNGGNG